MKKIISITFMLAAVLWFQNETKQAQRNPAANKLASLASLTSKEKHAHKVIKKASSPSGSNNLASSHQHEHSQQEWEKVPKAKVKFSPQNEAEKSLQKLGEIFSNSYDKYNREHEFKEFLSENDLGPRLAQDSNPDTGQMLMIRSQKSLPGTRYYHAQFFSNTQNEKYLQHASFEFRPGPNSFNRAKQMVQSEFAVKGQRVSKNGDHITYQLNDCYILWLKKMEDQDLKGDLYNAYSKGDIGTIKAAIELDIHCTS